MTVEQSVYDVVIIGGGPGGSCAAAFARQQGWRTLVAERCAFPRFKIGESLLPMGNEILRRTGAWEKVEAAGFFPKYGALFYLSNGSATKEVDFSKSLVPGLERTFQVERGKFDALLLDHARELGAEVRMKTAVRAIERGGAVHHVQLEGPTGPTTVAARWVIDASGRDNFFQTAQKSAFDPPSTPKRLAVYSHYRGVKRPAGRAEGHTVVVRLDDGWFWLIPLDAEKTSVGLVTTVEAMRAAKVSPEEMFQQAVQASPKLRELFASAEAMMGFQVTSDYTYFRRELAQERLLLVGDAAGFFDPIFSSGVYMSMWSSQLAIELIARADRAQRGLRPAECRSYTRALKEHADVFRRLIETFYDNESFAVFMSAAPWNLAPGLTSIVAGHAKLTWPLWWRFKIFLLICRLQHWLRVTPPLDYGTGEPKSAG
jgi:flavin-dependent dehydrogenase